MYEETCKQDVIEVINFWHLTLYFGPFLRLVSNWKFVQLFVLLGLYLKFKVDRNYDAERILFYQMYLIVKMFSIPTLTFISFVIDANVNPNTSTKNCPSFLRYNLINGKNTLHEDKSTHGFYRRDVTDSQLLTAHS